MLARVVVAATSNPGKVREFRTLLGDLPCEILALERPAAVRFPAEGTDYAANALAKARAVAEQLGEWALADDSGLEVTALGGAPGPLSARYGGAGLDDAARVAHLLAALEGRPEAQRGARFVCVAALVAPSGECRVSRGECPGQILLSPRGSGGFGYDPVFLPDGFTQAMAELAPEDKNRISHRGQAMARIRVALLEGDAC